MPSGSKTRKGSPTNARSKQVVKSAKFQKELDDALNSLVKKMMKPGPLGMTHNELRRNHKNFMNRVTKKFAKGGAKRITRRKRS